MSAFKLSSLRPSSLKPLARLFSTHPAERPLISIFAPPEDPRIPEILKALQVPPEDIQTYIKSLKKAPAPALVFHLDHKTDNKIDHKTPEITTHSDLFAALP